MATFTTVGNSAMPMDVFLKAMIWFMLLMVKYILKGLILNENFKRVVEIKLPALHVVPAQ